MRNKRRRRKARRNPVPLKGHPIKAAIAAWLVGGLVVSVVAAGIIPKDANGEFHPAGMPLVTLAQLALAVGAYKACK